MTSQPLECVEVNPGQGPVASILWLHGLGADGHDFEPIVPELGMPETLPIRYVFPHAPMRPVTLNGGMVMRAWFDILAAGFPRRARICKALPLGIRYKVLAPHHNRPGCA